MERPSKNRRIMSWRLFEPNFPTILHLIGTGGITSGGDAAEKIRLGANLVQFYTGFVYKGPDLVNDCLTAIAAQSNT